MSGKELERDDKIRIQRKHDRGPRKLWGGNKPTMTQPDWADRAGWGSPARAGAEGARTGPGPRPAWPHSGKQCPLGGGPHPSRCARQTWAHPYPCALTGLLVLGDPKEPPRGRAEGKIQERSRGGGCSGEGAELAQVPGTKRSSHRSGFAQSSQPGLGSGGWTYHSASTPADRQQCPRPGAAHRCPPKRAPPCDPGQVAT